MEKKVKYLNKDELHCKVEDFRGQYWPQSFPVDIEIIIERHLKLEIIPLPNLLRDGGTETYLTSDFKKIIVDSELYNNDRLLPRLRFGLAHEVGHYVLHRSFYGSYDVNSCEDYRNFISNLSESDYSRLEWQANEFAGGLLVSKKDLVDELEKLRDNFNVRKVSDPAMLLANKFKVSKQVVEVRLRSIA
ncbi:ImmA/IrrE family metallo-endopeptidase [Leptospira sp. GIMC2001]|uniref:ImmA/IrrE family metallo-endopeptidase n=1 Tax=Leptospira sp. GIMC2001 TaxID=1513297 RepID=UPI002349244B|nr:ImmA/IrrE family metallo-endopeptidase [Leptospira sp. GIMC2001]WCL50812.1 ImmA/IrrE family metallo-endopeptidase [Leptospira sp. GIMC2001]